MSASDRERPAISTSGRPYAEGSPHEAYQASMAEWRTGASDINRLAAPDHIPHICAAGGLDRDPPPATPGEKFEPSGPAGNSCAHICPPNHGVSEILAGPEISGAPVLRGEIETLFVPEWWR